MYELELIKGGFIIGYFVCIFAFCIGVMISYMILYARLEKYLINTKQMQKFEDWKIVHKKKLVFK